MGADQLGEADIAEVVEDVQQVHLEHLAQAREDLASLSAQAAHEVRVLACKPQHAPGRVRHCGHVGGCHLACIQDELFGVGTSAAAIRPAHTLNKTQCH